jgi:hypothetical protein
MKNVLVLLLLPVSLIGVVNEKDRFSIEGKEEKGSVNSSVTQPTIQYQLTYSIR